MRLTAVVVTAAVVLLSGRAALADLMQIESIDLAVMRSAVVVKGKVVKFTAEIDGLDEVGADGKDKGGALHDKSTMLDFVTVEISEVIKGDDKIKPDAKADPAKAAVPQRVVFMVRMFKGQGANLDSFPWRNMGSEMLFCLDKAGGQSWSGTTYGRADYVLRIGSQAHHWALALDGAWWKQVWGGAVQTLTTGPEVLDAVKAAAKAPATDKTFGVINPPSKDPLLDGVEVLFPDTKEVRAAAERIERAAKAAGAKPGTGGGN